MNPETDAVAETTLPAQPAAARGLAFKVIGVGETGCRVTARMTARNLTGVVFAGVDTDAHALDDCGLTETILLGQRTTRGLSAGGDANQARAVAEAELDRLRTLCQGVDILFVVAGLGRGTGTGVSPILARLARDSGALVLAVVTLPFEFEGPQLHRLAQHGLQQLRAAADGVICLPNLTLGKMLDENTSLADSERITFDLLADGVTAIWRMVTRRGFLRVDFSDLCAVLRGRHADSSLGTAEASGEQRAREVVEKLLAHPLLGDSQALARADALLLSIAGGPDLTRAQVTWVVEQFRRQAENAQMAVGASTDPAMLGRLSLTVVTARRAEGLPEENAGETLPSDAPERTAATAVPPPANLGPEIETSFFTAPSSTRPPSRLVPPAPTLTPEQQEHLLNRQAAGSARARKAAAKLRQGTLPLEVVAKGHFDKVEATVRDGQDLDVPTFVRRGMALN